MALAAMSRSTSWQYAALRRPGETRCVGRDTIDLDSKEMRRAGVPRRSPLSQKRRHFASVPAHNGCIPIPRRCSGAGSQMDFLGIWALMQYLRVTQNDQEASNGKRK